MIMVIMMIIPRYGEHTDAKLEKCFTDGTGPEVFQPCASRWVLPRDRNNTGEYRRYSEVQHGCVETEEPPSSEFRECKLFHQQIKKIGKKAPIETIFQSQKEQKILENSCFKTDPGLGWCATYKVMN